MSGVGLVMYVGCMPDDTLGFGTGWGYLGVLITLYFVGPGTIHTLCPSGSSEPVLILDRIVVVTMTPGLWLVLFQS